MKKLLVVLIVVASALAATSLEAGGNHANRVGLRYARTMPWHGPHYHTQYGYPIGLVVPPRASMQTKMQWGASGTEMWPIYHQFYRAYPGDYGGSSMVFSPTPDQPNHTDQFGVYYVRGPW